MRRSTIDTSLRLGMITLVLLSLTLLTVIWVQPFFSPAQASAKPIYPLYHLERLGLIVAPTPSCPDTWIYQIELEGHRYYATRGFGGLIYLGPEVPEEVRK